MKKFMGLVVLVAATAVTLVSPGPSEACGWRCRSCGYCCPGTDCCMGSYGCYTSDGSGCWNTWSPGYPAGYYYPTGRGYYAGYYRVGNVIINGRRWGDIGTRYSRGDLIRW